MKKVLFCFLYLVPKNYVSFLVGKVVHLERPRFFAVYVRNFLAKAFKINMAEAEHPLEYYPSWGSLFTRKLKAGARPVVGDIIHCADSRISQAGRIDKDIMIQAKGKFFRLGKLLNESEFMGKFEDGYFITYYLCPTDYHRVHAAAAGSIVESQYIPGKLWPVNDLSVTTISELFVINERTVSVVRAAKGHYAVVMVGATNVGKITLSYEPSIVTNQQTRELKISHNPPIDIGVGDELGIFHMGSTVVMLFEKSFFSDEEFKTIIKGPVKFGQSVPGTLSKLYLK